MKHVTAAPLRAYSAMEIKEIRNKLQMTQAVFALFMGVSKKTVEAWEAGQNTPSGASLRLLFLADNDPDLPQKYGIIQNEYVPV